MKGREVLVKATVESWSRMMWIRKVDGKGYTCMLDKRPGILVATSARGRKALLTKRKIWDGIKQQILVFSVHQHGIRKSI